MTRIERLNEWTKLYNDLSKNHTHKVTFQEMQIAAMNQQDGLFDFMKEMHKAKLISQMKGTGILWVNWTSNKFVPEANLKDYRAKLKKLDEEDAAKNAEMPPSDFPDDEKNSATEIDDSIPPADQADVEALKMAISDLNERLSRVTDTVDSLQMYLIDKEFPPDDEENSATEIDDNISPADEEPAY